MKLYLTITLLAAHSPYDTDRQIASRTWADALALEDAEGRGSRRIIDAWSWLEKNKFLQIERGGGAPPKRIILRNALGNDTEYVKPTSPYVSLPVGYWENQWITALSGTGTTLLLVLIELCGGKNREPVQTVDAVRKLEYCLSDDTWTRATNELKDFGLLTIGSASSASRDLEYARRRNTYELHKERLADPVPMDVLERRIAARTATLKQTNGLARD